MYDLLQEAAGKMTQTDWSGFIRDQNIEIEGIFYHRQDLYLGLKKPLKDDRAVIVRIRPDKVNI